MHTAGDPILKQEGAVKMLDQLVPETDFCR